MDEADLPGQEPPDPPDEDVEPGLADEDVDRLPEDDPYHERPVDDQAATGGSGRRGLRGHRDKLSEQDKWRRLAWVALIGVAIGAVGGLLVTVLVLQNQQDNVDSLIHLIKKGQRQRAQTRGQIQQNQKERQAAIQSSKEQSQMFRAETQQSNAQARQAAAEEAKAQSQANQADRQAALADAQANRINALGSSGPSGPSGSASQAIGEGAKALTAAIDALQATIEQLGKLLGPQPRTSGGTPAP
ncbi:MAG: hypothetical protein ACRDMH_09350 [Solirubrobacterales bacterium]